jgi:hypothetical protein
MSQKFEIIKNNDIIDNTNDQKNINNFNPSLDFDLLLDPLFDSFFKLPAIKDFKIEPYYSEKSLLENSLILANPISISTSSPINTTTSNNITTFPNNNNNLIVNA